MELELLPQGPPQTVSSTTSQTIVCDRGGKKFGSVLPLLWKDAWLHPVLHQRPARGSSPEKWRSDDESEKFVLINTEG